VTNAERAADWLAALADLERRQREHPVETHRILQMLPADGWGAVTVYEDGDIYCHPVAFWVLVEDRADQRHHPYETPTTEIEGWVDGIWGLQNAETHISKWGDGEFLGYTPLKGYDESEWRDEAQQRLQRYGRKQSA